MNRRGNVSWRWLILAGIIAGLAIAALILAQRMNSTAQPQNGNRLTGVKSDGGQFSISAQPETDVIPMNKMHAWTIRIVDANGQALDGVSIVISGGMPAHGHGLPTNPQVTSAAGDGSYRVEGLRFQMPGEWVVNFHVTGKGIDDSATLRFTLR